MIRARLWVPGIWPSTNQALALKRREGNPRTQDRCGRGTFAWWAAQGRAAAMYASRTWEVQRVPDDAIVSLWIHLVHHIRYDPSGWTLAGKWFEDGLVDAAVLVSDRRNVRMVGGRCLATAEESDAFVRQRFHGIPSGQPGAVVEIEGD